MSGNVEVVRVAERVSAAGARDLGAAVAARIARGQVRLVVDLAQTWYLDGAALAALVAALGAAVAAGGDVKLAAPRPPVRILLELTRLTRVFAVCDSVDDARYEFDCENNNLSFVGEAA